MLFNSIEFIFVFLPLTLFIFYSLTHGGFHTEAKVWLIIASLFFYGWWNPKYLLLIGSSIVFNYFFTFVMGKSSSEKIRKPVLAIGILFNISLLVYYKYADFFIENFNFIFDENFNLLHIILPLGISFFTFQQIALLVDSYKRIVVDLNFINYCLFVTFFPQLIAGPIVHHKEMMPQFLDNRKRRFNSSNFTKGIFVFNMGLAKKIVIADAFGKIANSGYANYELLDTLQSWTISFAYTCQLYFDFSGYSDMAIGIGLLFNIVIPNNFFSPHKSISIQEFYRRWHITLSRFLRDYIYIPLGGNKRGSIRTNVNLFLVFLIGGLWHGSSWTFVIWGALNGIAIVIHRMFKKTSIHIPNILAIMITFWFVMFVRIYFRAEDLTQAHSVIETMFGFGQNSSNFKLINSIYDAPLWIAGVGLLFMPNSTEVSEKFKRNFLYLGFLIVLIFLNLTFLNSVIKQDFLYFDF